MAFKKNDWVASPLQIGKVRMVHEDGLLDIVIFARDGRKVGRESDPMGGPTSFEPCCGPENWRRIKEPQFPLTRYAYIEEIVEFIEAEPQKKTGPRPGR